jgi:elongation factor Ts
MTVTLEQIKSLREKTGVSATAIKKALTEAGGDEAKALELLRKKGEAKAAERSDRATAHGVVGIAGDSSKMAVVAIGCETDFVAKNDEFVASVNALAEKVLAGGEDTDLAQDIADLNIQMGEKVEVKGQRVLEGAVVGSYIHLNKKIGVVVALDGSTQEVANDIAMHAAAMNPLVVSPSDISDELVAKEKEIWLEQLRAEGKPENIMDNIMAGKEKKFREEGALLSQPFVKNPDQKIQDLLDGANVVAFVRYAV